MSGSESTKYKYSSKPEWTKIADSRCDGFIQFFQYEINPITVGGVVYSILIQFGRSKANSGLR